MLGENLADIGGSIITDRKSFSYVPLILLSRRVLESAYRIGVGLVESEGLPDMIFATRRYLSGIVEPRLTKAYADRRTDSHMEICLKLSQWRLSLYYISV